MEYSLVMGASGGIGKEFCHQLARRGENLIISGRSKNKLELLKSELTKSYSISVITYELDLADSLKRQEFFSYAKTLGKICGLYYVSGIDTRKSFLKYSEEKLIMQARVNFEGALSLSKFALDNRSEKLKVLIVSSACGFQPMPYFSEYSATKGALVYFFKGLKTELNDKNLKLTLLCPSSVPTRKDIVEDIKSQGLTGKLAQKSPEYIVKTALKALDKNKTVCVPGLYNKLVVFISKITPYAVSGKFVAKKFKNKEKDAF